MAARKRVLQLCAVDFTVKHFLGDLVEFLEAKGLEVHVGCRRGAFWNDLLARHYRMVDLPFTRGANPLANAVALLRLWRYLAGHRFDIVHVHTPLVGVLGRLAARWARVPIRLYTAHGFYFHDEMPPALRRFCVAVERRAARWGHFIFTQSDEDRQAAIREGIAPPDRIATIGNGIDTKRFDPARVMATEQAKLREELDLVEGAPTIGIVARVVREKGVFELAEAVAAIRRDLPDVRVVLIGGALPSDRDDSTRAFRERLGELGITPHFRFAGFRNDVPALISLCNVYTLPSYREGMPRSILEAMAMALPVVATAIRGCREEVVEGETGFLIPPRDSRALAERLLRVLSRPDEARRMGEAGRRRAVEQFDYRLVLERQWTVYEKLMRSAECGMRNESNAE
jgi:glycosyltransferase involved in cell wall biosynthesis